MDLVVTIPEKLFNQLVELENPTYLAYCVINGKQLPKGHGRLIDADVLQDDFSKRCCGECYYCDYYTCENNKNKCGLIDQAPTVNGGNR